MSYYEKWFAWMLTTVVAAGDVTQTEIESGSPATGSPRKAVLVAPEAVSSMVDRRALRRDATSLSLHDSSRDSACARETFIHQGTRDYRVTCEARAVSSFSIAACFSFPTQTRICSAKNRSISTRCDSPRARSGANKRRRRDFIHLDMWDDYLEPV